MKPPIPRRGGAARKSKKLEVSTAMRIATEHLSYRSLIEEIENDLVRVRSAQGASMEGVLRLLRSFNAQVRRHFALEESGLFELYLEHDSDYREQAVILLAQHRDFRARLGQVLEVASALPDPRGPDFERLSRELRQLFTALREHERAEDALLDRLVEQDIRR